MKNKLILGGLLFSILGLLLMYMAGMLTEKVSMIVPTSQQSDISALNSVVIQSTKVDIEREFTGTVVADQKITLSARLTARIAEVLVDVGEQVKKGDILIRLDSGDLNAKVQQTQQAVSSAQAQLNIARKETKRLTLLYAKKLISPLQFEQVESQLQTAKANFEQAKAAVSEAETTFGFSIMTAPFDAVIEKRVVNEGDLATPGMPLLTLYNPATLQLESRISESLIQKVPLNGSLRYLLPGYSQQAVGKIVQVSPVSDSSSRSIVINLQLQTKEGVFPGSFGKVWVTVGQEERLIIPREAVFKVGQLDYIKVIEEGAVNRRLIQLGEGFTIRKGLKAGEQVVLSP